VMSSRHLQYIGL